MSASCPVILGLHGPITNEALDANDSGIEAANCLSEMCIQISDGRELWLRGPSAKLFIAQRLKSRRRHAAVTSQLRKSSRTPSQIPDSFFGLKKALRKLSRQSFEIR